VLASPVQARKHALRAASRASNPDGRARAGRDAIERLLALPELEECRTLSLYAAVEDEVPVEAATADLWARGLRTVFPRVSETGLKLFEVEDVDALEPGYGGIREPVAGLSEVGPGCVDVFFIPGMLFDRGGRRLGRGRGYYDRLLANARRDALRVGCSYADRVVEGLPTESWDVVMHLVVTEREVIRNERLGQ
jgi:5-formyltetrahydrofolate cyclo-ligase